MDTLTKWNLYAQELRILEEKANLKYGAYAEKINLKAQLLDENRAIEDEKRALLKQIESEQGNLSQYHERQAKCSAQRADLEIQLSEAQERLTQMEQQRNEANSEKKSLEQETVAIKKDIEELEIAIQKIEQEKTNRDHTIRSLNDDIVAQVKMSQVYLFYWSISFYSTQPFYLEPNPEECRIAHNYTDSSLGLGYISRKLQICVLYM